MNIASTEPQGLDALRIQAEIETADRSTAKRPTWAPAVVLEGELLELCHELKFLNREDKPVARLWATFADPKRRGAVIRSTYSKHPLSGIRCRGFEMRAGVTHDGGRMTDATMDADGSWSVGCIRWVHSDINEMRRWIGRYEVYIQQIQQKLRPERMPSLLSPEEVYEERIREGASVERAQYLAEYYRKNNAERLARWEEGERTKRDPTIIAEAREREAKYAGLLEKQRQKIAKEEANPDWRYKALTRMTELATLRSCSSAVIRKSSARAAPR